MTTKAASDGSSHEALHQQAMRKYRAGAFDEAEALFREELALCRQNEDSKEILTSITKLADTLKEQAECSPGLEAKAREAHSPYQEAVPIATDIFSDVWPLIELRLKEVATLEVLQGADANTYTGGAGAAR